MSYTEKFNIPGLLMLIDFQKVFDSVSWQFLYKVLEIFGFDEQFTSWVKLFISRRALAREGDYEMMSVCACVCVCVS